MCKRPPKSPCLLVVFQLSLDWWKDGSSQDTMSFPYGFYRSIVFPHGFNQSIFQSSPHVWHHLRSVASGLWVLQAEWLDHVGGCSSTIYELWKKPVFGQEIRIYVGKLTINYCKWSCSIAMQQITKGYKVCILWFGPVYPSTRMVLLDSSPNIWSRRNVAKQNQLKNMPRCSMYGIFTYIYPINGPNVCKYFHTWSIWDLKKDWKHWQINDIYCESNRQISMDTLV